MGELHLEIIVDRLLREFKVEANVGAPQVAYKETFTKAVDAEYKYAKEQERNLNKKQAEAALNAFTDAIAEALKAGDKVQLMGFGTFEVKERAARIGRKPSTGESIEIPAKKTPSFKAGKGFKDEF